MTEHHIVCWIDSGREPINPPDPNYLDGINIDLTLGLAAKSCTVPLPYPAPRCGRYEITCKKCRQKVAVTTAGRIDDPKSVKMGCFYKGMGS